MTANKETTMTEFRKDLEYWTDELVATQKDLENRWNRFNKHVTTLGYEDGVVFRELLAKQAANIHWLDQTVNHYPKPPKKFWQFWKK